MVSSVAKGTKKKPVGDTGKKPASKTGKRHAPRTRKKPATSAAKKRAREWQKEEELHQAFRELRKHDPRLTDRLRLAWPDIDPATIRTLTDALSKSQTPAAQSKSQTPGYSKLIYRYTAYRRPHLAEELAVLAPLISLSVDKEHDPYLWLHRALVCLHNKVLTHEDLVRLSPVLRRSITKGGGDDLLFLLKVGLKSRALDKKHLVASAEHIEDLLGADMDSDYLYTILKKASVDHRSLPAVAKVLAGYGDSGRHVSPLARLVSVALEKQRYTPKEAETLAQHLSKVFKTYTNKDDYPLELAEALQAGIDSGAIDKDNLIRTARAVAKGISRCKHSDQRDQAGLVIKAGFRAKKLTAREAPKAALTVGRLLEAAGKVHFSTKGIADDLELAAKHGLLHGVGLVTPAFLRSKNGPSEAMLKQLVQDLHKRKLTTKELEVLAPHLDSVASQTRSFGTMLSLSLPFARKYKDHPHLRNRALRLLGSLMVRDSLNTSHMQPTTKDLPSPKTFAKVLPRIETAVRSNGGGYTKMIPFLLKNVGMKRGSHRVFAVKDLDTLVPDTLRTPHPERFDPYYLAEPLHTALVSRSLRPQDLKPVGRLVLRHLFDARARARSADAGSKDLHMLSRLMTSAFKSGVANHENVEESLDVMKEATSKFSEAGYRRRDSAVDYIVRGMGAGTINVGHVLPAADNIIAAYAKVQALPEQESNALDSCVDKAIDTGFLDHENINGFVDHVISHRGAGAADLLNQAMLTHRKRVPKRRIIEYQKEFLENDYFPTAKSVVDYHKKIGRKKVKRKKRTKNK